MVKRITSFLTHPNFFLPGALLLALSFNSSAQMFYNNGAVVYVAPVCTVQVNGGLENFGATAQFTNDGWMQMTLNSTQPIPGSVRLSSSSSMNGNGMYRVEQDWINNANFTANTSTVELYGNLQEFITGSNVTTFHNLTLSGTGSGVNRKKTQTLDANIDATGTMDIKNRELETQTNTMFVLNPSVLAIQMDSTVNAEGFVSSQDPGVLSRETNSTGSYLYPTGSSVNLTRYRPVRVMPTAATATAYTVRFINHNADLDGFNRAINDGLICNAIDTFYHAILRTGANPIPANITVYYNPTNDGTWTGLSHWRTNNNMWNDMAAVVNATSGPFTMKTRNNWLFANPGFPYILTEKKPQQPTLNCNNVCANSLNNLFTVTGTGTMYNWTVVGGQIVNGQGTSTINVNWGGNNGMIIVTDSSSVGCTSVPDTCFVTVYPSPTALFDTTSTGVWHNTWNFADLSTGGPITSWYWNFGDSTYSNQQNPTHIYNAAGTYTVTLIVTNSNGCIDTLVTTVTVNEGILIPNVFSPNGDGWNDQFYISNSGVKEFSIEIFNRWGTKIFETTAPEIRWDGRSTSGVMMSDGTYYFILKAVLKSGKDYSTTGFLSLLQGQTK